MSVEVKSLSSALTTDTLNKTHRVAIGEFAKLPSMSILASLPLPDANTRNFLVKIAEDSSVPIRLRKVAILSLGRFKDLPLDVIQNHALNSDAGIASVAIKILGRVGDASSLNVLDRLQSDSILKPRIAFAAALICHRFNLQGYDLPSVKSATYLDLPGTTIPVDVRSTSPEEETTITSTLEQHSLALPAALATWSIECSKKHWALVLDKSLLSPWRTDQFVAKKLYLGQLATRNQTTGTYAPGLTLLATGKSSDNIEIGIYRSNGQLMYGGEGHIEGEVLHFSIQATDHPGASAVVVEGSYSVTGLNLKISSAINRTRPALQPSMTKIANVQ